MPSLGRSLIRVAAAALRSLGTRRASERSNRTPRNSRDRRRTGSGTARFGYAPTPGSTADPGEIVWAWVPYEEDPSQGKDRPVLVIGREKNRLLALMLTSKDRNNGTRRHSGYVDIGSGSWDRKGRPSEVYLERVLRIRPDEVRRIGATLERPLFDRVIGRLRRDTGR